MASGHKIRILDDSVARKIAAGEVIDRPHSLVRELMDNAIDADALSIDTYLRAGGLQSVRVVDDGTGMSREDLEICFFPHATSKIERESDLEELHSLGFRGEALTSIASVAKLDIISKEAHAQAAHRLTAANGKMISLERHPGQNGTTVEVSDLFYNMPARKRFLKRPGAETGMGKSIFIEKALPFPERRFRLFTDDKLKLFLPPAPLPERLATCFPDQLHQDLLYEVTGSGDGFSFTAVLGAPDLARRDRKMMQVFVNKRRIWEFSLVQAMEHAYEEILHGGIYPAVFLFLELAPHLVDFNVHPAKREAKFHNIREVHSRVVRVLREFLSGFARRVAPLPDGQQEFVSPGSGSSYSGSSHAREQERGAQRAPVRDAPYASDVAETYRASSAGAQPSRIQVGRRDRTAAYADTDFGLDVRMPAHTGDCEQLADRSFPDRTHNRVRYIGQLFDLFLLAEYGGKLYMVDQHAGHERVLYERILKDTRSQALLIPEEFEVDPDQEAALRENREGLRELGIHFEEVNEGRWKLTQVPAGCESNTQAIIETALSRALPESGLGRRFFAIVACKAAIKDGETVDSLTAEKLLDEVFSLPDGRCPHGRPIWHEITKEELLHSVGRV